MFDVKELLIGMSSYVQYISFGLLMLSGLCMPISEDIVFILSASIAATVVPENMYYIFAGCFLGAYLSDIMAYFIGRHGINTILHCRLLIRLKLINPEKMESRIGIMRDYFASYGGKTLFFGRFIPFGMRNVIFMTCGFIRMNPMKFMIIDFCAVTCTSLILFSLGYSFGNNYEVIFPYFNRYKFILLIMVFGLLIIIITKNKYKKKSASQEIFTDTITIPKNINGK